MKKTKIIPILVAFFLLISAFSTKVSTISNGFNKDDITLFSNYAVASKSNFGDITQHGGIRLNPKTGDNIIIYIIILSIINNKKSKKKGKH